MPLEMTASASHTLAPAREAEGAVSACVRGNQYRGVRVDVKAGEVQLLGVLAQGGASTVYRGLFAGAHVAVKKPRLATVTDMDRYHTELRLLR